MSHESMMYVFFPLLFVIAFLYASVGHGGASGYMALMILFGFSSSVIRSSALALNIFVSLIAFIQFCKGGYFKWRLFWPFVITSIPASFIGSFIVLDEQIYKKVLGILLIFPILRLLGFFGKERGDIAEVNPGMAIIIGGLIGLLSGMIGIGGGIILSPVILLLRWGDVKQTAGVSSLFIFVNSISGFGALLINGLALSNEVYGMLAVAIAGGLLGAYFSRSYFDNKVLKYILSSVLVIAIIKLLSISK